MSWTLDLHTGANTWISQTKFPNPDKVFLHDETISTSQENILIDGSKAMTQPEKTYRLQPFTLGWSKRPNTTLHTRILNYIKSGSGLRFTTHTGYQFIGQFTKVTNEWKFSGNIKRKQKYNLEVEFEQLEVDMLRDQQW
jgi:aminopeptidase N